MLYIIALILIVFIVVAIIKAVGSVFIRLVSGIAKFFGTIIWVILFGPAALCERIFFYVINFLHLQGPLYFLLSICSPFSFIYYLFVHLPYSLREIFVREKDFFREKKHERYKAIGMGSFLFLYNLVFIIFLKDTPIMEDYIPVAFYAFISFCYSFMKGYKWIKSNHLSYKQYVAWKKWTKTEAPSFTLEEIEEKVEALVADFTEVDKNKQRFTSYNMVFGRTTAFLSYFGKNTETDEPLYFSPVMSPNEDELREYGLLVTNKGIYISQYNKTDIEIPFEGIWKLSAASQDEETTDSQKCLKIDYGLDKVVHLEKQSVSLPLENLQFLLEEIIADNIPLAFLQGQVTTEFEEILSECEKLDTMELVQEQFNKQQNLSDLRKATEIAGLKVGLEKNQTTYDAVKRNFDGQQGHGTAAEYANNAIDKLIPGSDAKHLGADNKKGGADRSLFGKQIQSKYYKSANKSVNSAFDGANGSYKYYEKLPNGEFKLDANGEKIPMKLEVAPEQYKESVKEMQKKIDNGQVEGAKDAKEIVKKGHVTYQAAYNIAGSGSLESITIDAVDGIANSLPGASISALITFTTSVWNGENVEEAAKQSSIVMLKTIGKSAVIHTITMQLSRGKVVNPLYGIKKGAQKYSENYIATGARKIAEKINSSSIAQSSTGKKLGLDKIDDKKLISGTVTTVVVFGPDVGRALQGKISGKQLIKNSLVNTAGMVGSALGAGIPVVGSMAVGTAFLFAAKKLLDNFIEDDSVRMFRIVREEFLESVMLHSFNKAEFDSIISKTLAREDMPKILQNMYQSGEPQEYIRAILNTAIQETLGSRKKITNEMYIKGLHLLEEKGA